MNEKRHPIQVVARRTGLSADVLRAWEKRYGILEPARSRGGRRLYADDDIEYLRLLRRATSAGRNVGQLVSLSRAELEAIVREDDAAAAVGPAGTPVLDLLPTVDQALSAVEALDGPALGRILRRAMVESDAALFLDRVVAPLLTGIGTRWEHRQFTPAHEHLASGVLRRVLAEFTESFPGGPDAAALVSATLTGQRHEFGAMLAAATAAALGWRVFYLGADLPAAAIAAAARQADATVVALSFVHPADDPSVAAELRALRDALPGDVVLLAGGACVDGYAEVLHDMQALVVSELARLRTTLTSLVGERRPRR